MCECKGTERGSDWHVTEITTPIKPPNKSEAINIPPQIESALRCHIQKGVQTIIDSGRICTIAIHLFCSQWIRHSCANSELLLACL